MVYLGLLDRSPLFTNLRFMLHACICMFVYVCICTIYVYVCEYVVFFLLLNCLYE